MPIVPNERLIAEALQKRMATEAIPKSERKVPMTEKGIREITALFAIRESVLRGEQPELSQLERFESRHVVVELVDKVIPPHMKERGEEL